MRLEGKVAVITGAGNGVGAACARRFAAEGARIVLADWEREAVEAVAEDVDGIAVVGDMTREADVQAVAEAANARFGGVDLWFSNAGISGPRAPRELLGDEHWERMWGLHVMAHVYAARVVLPQMIARGHGYLLQTVSSVALSTHPEKAAYSVTKHAGLALGEWLATQHRDQGVAVSCFCPGAMRTRMLASNGFDEGAPIMARAIAPEQVADLLVAGIGREDFLILTPDADVDALAERARDYDGWLGRMAEAMAESHDRPWRRGVRET